MALNFRTKQPQNDSILMRELGEFFPEFALIVRDICLERFSYLTKCKDQKICSDILWDDFCYGSRIAVITIIGKDLRICFKSHVYLNKIRDIVKLSLDEGQIEDLFKEYANLVAGAVKDLLQHSGLIVGIGLPTVMSGFDEAFLSDKIRNNRFYDYFKIIHGEGYFANSITIDIDHVNLENALRFVKKKINIVDDIEFL